MSPLALRVSKYGSVFGVLGALFICLPSQRCRALGFTLFLFSNVFMLIFHGLIRAWWPFGTQIVFTTTSVIGIWSNL